ncbi:MAG TPA: LptF/LptG family permease [Longimicrobiales bacterium]
MRIRLLDRYVAREFARLFLLFVISAPVLFILGDVMDNLDKHMARGLTVGQVALSYVYQTPLFALYSLPVASLIATVFTVSNMTRHFELSAAKAGGISFFRLFAPLPVLGVILTLVGLGLSELVPVTNRMRAEVLGELEHSRSSRNDFVYRAADGRVFAIRRLDARRGRIIDVVMEREGNEPEVPSASFAADLGLYEKGAGWTFHNGSLRLFHGRGEERLFTFKTLHPIGFTETPEELLAEPREPEEMGYAELGRFIDIIRRSGGRPLELMVKREQKLAIPAATLVIILFAMPLATSSKRGGSAYGIGVSLAITIFYLMLIRVAGAIGISGAIPPVVAAWIPNALVAAGAAGLLARIRS